MATSILNTSSHLPVASLQIKYVSRLSDARISPPFFNSTSATTRHTPLPHTPMISATVSDNTSTRSWTLSTLLRNVSSIPSSQSVKIYAWPMFEPEAAQLVASGSTAGSVAPSQAGKVEVTVPKRELASFNSKTGKWVLEEGIYMFEVRGSDDLRAGMSVVKQVSVVGNMVWDE